MLPSLHHPPSPCFPYPAECIKFQIYLCFSFVAASSAGPAFSPAYKMCFKLKNFAIFFAAFWKQQNLCRYFFNADSSRLSSSFQRLEVFFWFYFIFFWRQVAIWQTVPIGLPLCRSLSSQRSHSACHKYCAAFALQIVDVFTSVASPLSIAHAIGNTNANGITIDRRELQGINLGCHKKGY